MLRLSGHIPLRLQLPTDKYPLVNGLTTYYICGGAILFARQ